MEESFTGDVNTQKALQRGTFPAPGFLLIIHILRIPKLFH